MFYGLNSVGAGWLLELGTADQPFYLGLRGRCDSIEQVAENVRWPMFESKQCLATHSILVSCREELNLVIISVALNAGAMHDNACHHKKFKVSDLIWTNRCIQ